MKSVVNPLSCLRFAAVLSAALFLTQVSAIAAEFGLVPLPVTIEKKAGQVLHLVAPSQISAEPGNEDAERAVKYFKEKLKMSLAQLPGTPSANLIAFKKIKNAEAIKNHPEGYVIDISEKGIEVEALTYAGFFNASQTLLQLAEAVPQAGLAFPQCRIADYPRFAWRGFMLDSVRHYQSPEWIKKLIDLLASQKINTLHWHLTDDQGWRIEIKKYPKLTESAAWRPNIGFGLKPEDSVHYNEKGQYGGFYSQEQVRDIVRYAAERNITIVPEIELPGHAVAALSVYPEFGCTGGPYEIRLIGGVSDDVYCAGNEKLYSFLEDVVSEVAALFPGTFFHVGGDECPKLRWKSCPKCQAKIKAEGLRNEHELQSYVIRRMEKVLAAKGKRLIGWDEILEGGLAPNATVMSWRGASGGIAAAKMGHDVVMTPNSHCYFDYSQARTGEPRSFGGFIPLELVYNFNPTAGVPAEFRKHVLGGQANLWTEYIPNEKHAEYMIAPRISALAEVTWSPQSRLDWADFQKRMLSQFKRYEAAGVNYRRPDGVLIRAVPGGISASPDIAGFPILYTTDGSAPSINSPRVRNGFIKIPETSSRIRIRARVILPDGTLGRISSLDINLPKATVKSTLGTTDANFPERAIDGSRASVYWSDRCPNAGDTLTATFARPQPATRIRCLTGKNDNGGGGDRLKNGALEISADGTHWEKIATFNPDGIAEALLPAGTRLRAVRIRVEAAQHEWLVVREIEIE